MHGVVMRVQRRQEEDEIQASIIDMVKVAGIEDLIYYAVPNGGKRPIKTAKSMKATGVIPGVYDITFICPATAIAHLMEVKTETGVLSSDQKAFTRRLLKTPIPHAVVRSRDEAQDVLTRWGFLRVVKLLGEAA